MDWQEILAKVFSVGPYTVLGIVAASMAFAVTQIMKFQTVNYNADLNDILNTLFWISVVLITATVLVTVVENYPFNETDEE